MNTMKSLLQVMDNLCKTIPQIAVNFECLQSAKQQVNVLNNDNRLNSSVALETTSNEINESLVSP